MLTISAGALLLARITNFDLQLSLTLGIIITSYYLLQFFILQHIKLIRITIIYRCALVLSAQIYIHTRNFVLRRFISVITCYSD